MLTNRKGSAIIKFAAKSGGDEIEKSQKKNKKVLTNDKTHDIISELRREIQHRTLTNKQQCNPENSK